LPVTRLADIPDTSAKAGILTKSNAASSGALAQLRAAWADQAVSTGAEQILPADRTHLEKPRVATTLTYDEYIAELADLLPDSRLHLSLCPQPWIGNPATARVIVLMLNPGLGPMDYYAEISSAKNEEYLAALHRNLLGHPSEYPFFFLDPQFIWHPGATYWHRRFDWMIGELAKHGMSVAASTKFIAREVCCMQLVPYHSANFRLGDAFVNSLKSTKLAKASARELAKEESRKIVVMRAQDLWSIPESDNVALAEDAHRRSAFLTRGSSHGDAILEHLQRLRRDS